MFYDNKPAQFYDDEKLEIADLDSKSSESSDGYHFEITEARKKSRNKAKNRNVSQPPTANKIEMRDPAIEQTSISKSKESETVSCYPAN